MKASIIRRSPDPPPWKKDLAQGRDPADRTPRIPAARTGAGAGEEVTETSRYSTILRCGLEIQHS